MELGPVPVPQNGQNPLSRKRPEKKAWDRHEILGRCSRQRGIKAVWGIEERRGDL